ncbi:hypothetical protein HDF19_08395 [Mucilaginibacter sp. E4BP6]|uniref:hypothetical protein n=1 Tax=Mucilaginibacter sp. E4BP6 TaxID=2723089 RepID=UPI0015CCAC52|nr:hypothetical protein [Mucilaginibacter sp. E4BP6]NYE68605.1 hypothetical protein [Mucilaginibacter sp. E4BP6]
MREITITDENGTPWEYTYILVPELYNGLPVDQFEVRAKGDQQVPYMIQAKETDNEVRILLQHNNGNPAVSKKNIFGGMLPAIFEHYKKEIVSSSIAKPRYENERRVPETAGKMYNKLFNAGLVWYDKNRDVYYYRGQ